MREGSDGDATHLIHALGKAVYFLILNQLQVNSECYWRHAILSRRVVYESQWIC